MRDIPTVEINIPEKKVDISEIITNVYGRIKLFLKQKSHKKLTFSQLSPSDKKEDMVFTFIPLLHLSNQRKVDLMQYRHFGEIEINLLKNVNTKEINKELSVKS